MTQINPHDTEQWKAELKSFADDDRIKILSSFFKTGKGEYGEGDIFIGLYVPLNRKVSKRYFDLPLEQIEILLTDKIHEFRLAALLALVEAYKKSKNDIHKKNSIIEFYLAHTANINNWYLVHLSAPYIIGNHILSPGDDSIALKLAASSSMWEQRMGIVSTMTPIRHGRFDTTFTIANQMLNHKDDLIHKATGWMLREIGKKDLSALESYLQQKAHLMPRTMLRYAIERFPPEKRTYYLSMRK